MSKLTTVTRRQILEAIRYEPLQHGTWIDTDAETGELCSVCAVGATLRRAGMNAREIRKYGEDLLQFAGPVTTNVYDGTYDAKSIDATVKRHLENGLYMSALSLKFEYLSENYRNATVRRKLAEFVKKYFPKEIRL